MVHRTSARLVTRPFISLTSLLRMAFPTTSIASNAAIAKALFRCAATPPWMEFFSARLILSSFSRKQAASRKTSPHVSAKANNEQSKVPNKYGSVFCGTQDKCAACKKTVYPLEKMTLEGEPYHKTCFKCAHGGCILTTASYASLNGILYCQNHFWQLFKETGSYSNLLKPASKNAEEPEAAKEEEQAPEAVEDQVPEAVEDQEHS
uniref:LIM zinc-binding domain-containing protein n=1 Tax=Aegilops tauschii subsp. strangulata TaxID=200361 RepID=A0A452YJN4_AEGTS